MVPPAEVLIQYSNLILQRSYYGRRCISWIYCISNHLCASRAFRIMNITPELAIALILLSIVIVFIDRIRVRPEDFEPKKRTRIKKDFVDKE